MAERTLNDRYVLDAPVGEGGMAQTFRGRDLLLNRTVAVKLMREQFTADPQFVERFRREAQAAAKLTHHENIAGVYDAGQCDGRYFMVMEFIEGTDLKQRIRREGPLPILASLEIARQVASALEAAHRGGLIHRDIKPHNILLNAEGKVKVTDFGIAKAVTDGEDTGVIIGSVHYISPEHARGDLTTPLSDLYSLGAVLFEMLTGRTIFDGENAVSVARKQAIERPPMPRTLRHEIPPAVEALVLRLLEKDPRARFQSATEVKGELTALINRLSQEETQVMPRTSIEETQVFRPVGAATGQSGRGTYQQPRDPFLPGGQPETPSLTRPPRQAESGGAWWAIVLLFVVLSGLVVYGVFVVLGPGKGPINPGPVPTGSVSVPDVKGRTRAEAVRMLQEKRLDADITEKLDDNVAAGTIVSQEPLAGTMVDERSKVRLVVSTKKPDWPPMPNVLGKTPEQGQNLLKEVGFTGAVTRKDEPSDTVGKGLVVRADPSSGLPLDLKGTVTLYVSTGKPPTKKWYWSGSAPNIGGDVVFVRIDVENPIGSQAKTMVNARDYKPDDQLGPLEIEVPAGAKARVHIMAGPDLDSLTEAGVDEGP